MASRADRHCQNVLRDEGVPEIVAEIVARYGSKVQAGPFAGLVYLTESAGSSSAPKLLGCYEEELHGVWAEVLRRQYDTVVDVGCAEGFYAVGLARILLPGAKVIAFDVNPKARDLCRDLAHANGVGDRVKVEGACDPERLERTLQGASLVVCDCEGYEVDLLDPTRVPSLARADIVVELHDQLRPGAKSLILERFKASHVVELIRTRDRAPSDYPGVAFLSPRRAAVAVSEFRNWPQEWAFLTAHSRRVVTHRSP